jgi:hypothetical protein
MSKAALLIGINYKNTSHELYGCINDVNDVKKILISHYNFNEENIKIISDDSTDPPTRQNIMNGIDWLIEKNKNGCNGLWFHYSGHGSYILDKNNDETDGYDETIYTVDDKEITDDELKQKLVTKITNDTKLFCFMDCCFSGTQLDLNSNITNNTKVICISGCRDDQTAADAFFKTRWSGAMTTYLLKILKKTEYEVPFRKLIKKLNKKLKKNGFTQRPQLSSNFKIKKHFRIQL